MCGLPCSILAIPITLVIWFFWEVRGGMPYVLLMTQDHVVVEYKGNVAELNEVEFFNISSLHQSQS
jgi:hypothetical protein